MLKRSDSAFTPNAHSKAFLSSISPATGWTLGNDSSPQTARPDRVPTVEILGEADSERRGWNTIRARVDGRERTIEWPPGVDMTEKHLGAQWQSFGAAVYRDLFRELREGNITGSDHEPLDQYELWILQQRGGVWWALKTKGARVRIVGLGFLYIDTPHLIVQSAMIWDAGDRKSGIYIKVLRRLREWIRPGTIFSDVHMSVQAVGSWQRSVADGESRWDEEKGRFRRNPRTRPSRRR